MPATSARLYAALAADLRYEADIGLQSVLTRLLLADRTRAALADFADSKEAGDLWWPLSRLCRCAHEEPEVLCEEQSAWTALLGLDLNWANYPYKRRAALSRLKVLASMFAAVGFGGLVILFDEAETIDQLWNIRSRGTAYTTIGAVCEAPALWSVFSITRRFERTIDADIERFTSGGVPLEAAGDWFLSNWLHRKFKIVTPPPLHDGLGPEIATRVAGIYAEAYGVELDGKTIDKCIGEWARNPLRNPRRLVRIVVETLDQGRPLADTKVV